MNKEFKELIGYEVSIIDLSNKIYKIGQKVGAVVDDICDYGNWSEILESGDVVVAIDEKGEQHIQIFFEVLFTNGEDEMIESTIVKITNVEDF